MNCRTFQEQLLTSDAINNINSEMSDHLSSCTACREAAALVQQFNEQFRTEKEIACNPFIAERIVARLQSKQQHTKKGSYSKVIVRLAFTLLAGIAFGILVDSWVGTNADESPAASAAIATTDDLLNPDENLISLNY